MEVVYEEDSDIIKYENPAWFNRR